MHILVFKSRNDKKTVAVVGIAPENMSEMLTGDSVASLEMGEHGRRCFHRADVVGVICSPDLASTKERMGNVIGRVLWEGDLSRPHRAPEPAELSTEEAVASLIQHEDGHKGLRLALTRADVDALADVTKRGEMAALAHVAFVDPEGRERDLLIMANVFEDVEERAAAAEKFVERHRDSAVLSGEWKAAGQA